MSLDGTVTTQVMGVTFTNVVRTDSILTTLDGGYCFTLYDDQGNEVYVEMTAECAQLLRDKMGHVVRDVEWVEEEGKYES